MAPAGAWSRARRLLGVHNDSPEARESPNEAAGYVGSLQRAIDSTESAGPHRTQLVAMVALGTLRVVYAAALSPHAVAACALRNSATPSAPMSKDGLRRLPEHVTAQLLRALLTLPRTAESRLLLRRVEERRAPLYILENDYRVIWRGQSVGRIDREPKPYPVHEHVLWRWFLNDEQRKRMASGRAATREEAMAAFRRAWEQTPTGVIAKGE